MSRKPLPIGVDNFKKLIEQGYYFVDKTLPGYCTDLKSRKAVYFRKRIQADYPAGHLFVKPVSRRKEAKCGQPVWHCVLRQRVYGEISRGLQEIVLGKGNLREKEFIFSCFFS